MISPQRVRELVAELPGAQEGAHHGHPDFRVKKKIFATLSETEEFAALRLTHIEARALAERQPATYRPVSDREPIGWVSVLLASADEAEFIDLLEAAWSLLYQPGRLVTIDFPHASDPRFNPHAASLLARGALHF